MKYIKGIILIAFILVSATAQLQITVGVHIGSHSPFLQEEIRDGNFESLVLGDSRLLNSSAKISYGKGTEYGIGIGYLTKKNLLFGIDISWLDGDEYNKTITFTISSEVETHSGKSFRINPYVQSLIPLSTSEKFNVYTRVGALVALNNEIFITELEEKRNPAFGNGQFEVRYSGGYSFGLVMGTGLCYRHTPSLMFQIGAKGVFQNYSPEQREVVSFISGGIDLYPSLTTRSRITEYVDEFILDVSAPINESRPSKALKEFFPFSSLGIELAVRYIFK
ncbi:MAG: hypothetical protein AAFN81_16685 [Bacteroidota bacterium]